MSYQDLTAKYADQLSESRQQVLKLEQELARRDSLPACSTQTEEVSALREDLNRRQTEIEELRVALKAQQVQVGDKIASVVSLEREVKELQNELQKQNQDNLQSRENFKPERNEADFEKERILTLEASIVGLELEVKAAKILWEDERQQSQGLKDTVKAQSQESESKQSQIPILGGTVVELKAGLKTNSAQLTSLNALVAAQQALVDERDARIVDLVNLPSEEDEEQDSSLQQIQELCAAFENRQTELQAFQAQSAVLESNVAALQAQGEAKERKIEELEEALDAALALRPTTGENDSDLLASRPGEARDRAERFGQTLLQTQSDLAATRKDLKHSWETIRLWEERHKKTSEHLGEMFRRAVTTKLALRKELEELLKQVGKSSEEWSLKEATKEVGKEMLETENKFGSVFQGCERCTATERGRNDAGTISSKRARRSLP